MLLFPFCKDNTQLIFLEKRRIFNDKLKALIQTNFKKYFNYQPTYILLIKDEADINLSVDKSEIILKNCRFIENKIKSEMDRYFSNKTFINGNIEDNLIKRKVNFTFLDETVEKNVNLLDLNELNNNEKRIIVENINERSSGIELKNKDDFKNVDNQNRSNLKRKKVF